MSSPESHPLPLPEPSFAGTVDLALIHRGNPSEAFLTDLVPTGPHDFVAGAVLPAEHPHYRGHTGPSRARDPLLLLECARQAETCAAHAQFGVEPDARFVLRTWSAELTPGGLAPPGRTELTITAVTRNPKLMRDRIRGLDYELVLWEAGTRIGVVRMEVGYVSGSAYTVLRARKHNGSLPSSDDLGPTSGTRIDPARVGRLRATDVVLLDVEGDAALVTARLRVPTENPSLFDHAQDHVPAMVLMEAARQLATLATHEWGGAAPDHSTLVSMRASFAAYAELAEPVELRATPRAGGRVAVVFRQAGTELAEAEIGMAGPARNLGRGPAWLGPRS